MALFCEVGGGIVLEICMGMLLRVITSEYIVLLVFRVFCDVVGAWGRCEGCMDCRMKGWMWAFLRGLCGECEEALCYCSLIWKWMFVC